MPVSLRLHPRQPSRRGAIDPGWLYVLAGVTVLAAWILIPVQRQTESLDERRQRLESRLELAQARTEAHEIFLADLGARDRRLLEQLAISCLNRMPAGQRPIVRVTGPPMTFFELVDAHIGPPMDGPAAAGAEPHAPRLAETDAGAPARPPVALFPVASDDPGRSTFARGPGTTDATDATSEPSADASSRLERLVDGPARLWVAAGAVLSIFVGLVLGPTRPDLSWTRPVARGERPEPKAERPAVSVAAATAIEASTATARMHPRARRVPIPARELDELADQASIDPDATPAPDDAATVDRAPDGHRAAEDATAIEPPVVTPEDRPVDQAVDRTAAPRDEHEADPLPLFLDVAPPAAADPTPESTVELEAGNEVQAEVDVDAGSEVCDAGSRAADEACDGEAAFIGPRPEPLSRAAQGGGDAGEDASATDPGASDCSGADCGGADPTDDSGEDPADAASAIEAEPVSAACEDVVHHDASPEGVDDMVGAPQDADVDAEAASADETEASDEPQSDAEVDAENEAADDDETDTLEQPSDILDDDAEEDDDLEEDDDYEYVYVDEDGNEIDEAVDDEEVVYVYVDEDGNEYDEPDEVDEDDMALTAEDHAPTAATDELEADVTTADAPEDVVYDEDAEDDYEYEYEDDDEEDGDDEYEDEDDDEDLDDEDDDDYDDEEEDEEDDEEYDDADDDEYDDDEYEYDDDEGDEEYEDEDGDDDDADEGDEADEDDEDDR